MRAETKGNCFECGIADLVPATIEVKGTVRGEDYNVSMRGLKCPNCGFQTIEGRDMPEYGRLLADKYRSAHNLLTSDEIIALRHGFGESQQAFADRIGVGIASIKRWELGKIQDGRYDELIREKTKTTVLDISQYKCTPTESHIGSGTSYTFIGSGTSVAASFVNSGPFVCVFFKNDEINTQIYGGLNRGDTTGLHDLELIPTTTAPMRYSLTPAGGFHGR
jgi:putative zinc finger/helix-turn-helix YgiT family protein